MRLLAAITEPTVARRILECLALPPRAPPLAPANEFNLGLVVGDSAFEMTPAEADEDPGFDFDQSPVEDPTPNDKS
jgi:hypothetical protein